MDMKEEGKGDTGWGHRGGGDGEEGNGEGGERGGESTWHAWVE